MEQDFNGELLPDAQDIIAAQRGRLKELQDRVQQLEQENARLKESLEHERKQH